MEKINTYLNNAIYQAKELFGNREKLTNTVDRAFKKVIDIDEEGGEIKRLTNKVKLFIRMIRAYVAGEYQEVPWKTMLMILAGVLYFLNPFDIIPDFIPGLGFLDDATIILYIFKSVEDDIFKFQDSFYMSN